MMVEEHVIAILEYERRTKKKKKTAKTAFEHPSGTERSRHYHYTRLGGLLKLRRDSLNICDSRRAGVKDVIEIDRF